MTKQAETTSTPTTNEPRQPRKQRRKVVVGEKGDPNMSVMSANTHAQLQKYADPSNQNGVLYQLRSYRSVVLDVGFTIQGLLQDRARREQWASVADLPRHLSVWKLHQGRLTHVTA